MWILSSSSDKRALEIVDGIGRWERFGPHYSRRSPGSATFTGVGREIVLVTYTLDAVWAVVLQKTPAKRGSGTSRSRLGQSDSSCVWLWRNNMFRNLSPFLSSDLIRRAVQKTKLEWIRRYGSLPDARMRTEIDTRKVQSDNPGWCYICAGWKPGEIVRGKRYLYAPE